MQVPQYLQKGDTVLLVAPARNVNQGDLREFEAWINGQGWILEFAPNLFSVDNQFAGTDDQRANDLIWALSHPTAKAIFTARGGYGSVRTLEAMKKKLGDLDCWLQTQHPKWFVGFSDVTTIHLWLQKNNWVSIHGPVATQWSLQHESSEKNQLQLANVLNGNPLLFEIGQVNVYRPANFNGELIGGNLSLLYAALGTDLQPVTDGKVLLIEDLDEYLYHVDRMLMAFKNAGLFNNIQALLVGSMIDMNDNAVPFGKTVKEMILDLLGEANFPVVFDVPMGHDKQNYAVKLGAVCNFDNSTLTQ
jgi:muramoyltetrapeptide carboxypeptidase